MLKTYTLYFFLVWIFLLFLVWMMFFFIVIVVAVAIHENVQTSSLRFCCCCRYLYKRELVKVPDRQQIKIHFMFCKTEPRSCLLDNKGLGIDIFFALSLLQFDYTLVQKCLFTIRTVPSRQLKFFFFGCENERKKIALRSKKIHSHTVHCIKYRIKGKRINSEQRQPHLDCWR